MKFQFLPENFSRSENAPPFETRKIRLFEVERIFLKNKKMLDDSKNVLWNRGEPFIIDWEAAGPVPPALELWEALLNWGRDGGGKLRPDRIAALLDAYRQWNSLPPPDWESVGHAGYAGMLGWLNYNIARSSNPALSPEERQLGAEQTAITLKEIIEYEEQAPQLRRLIDG